MNSNILQLVVIIMIGFEAISCSSPIDEIDETSKSQSEQVTKLVNLTVVINDKFNGQFLYQVEIFDNAPNVANAALIKTGYGSQDLVFSSTIKLPEAQKTIYIRQTDPVKNQIIKQIDINSNEVVCDFR